MPRRHLSAPQVAQIVTLVEEGYNYRQVGDRMDVSSSVVSRAYNRYLETGGYQRRVGQGRRRATNPRDDRAIVWRVRQEPFVPANVVARNFPNRRQQQQQQNDRRPRVWRRQGERFSRNFTRPVAAYNGGLVMVWGGVSRFSRTPLVIVHKNLNATRYINQILRSVVLPRRQQTRGFIFMQDNARPHTANVTRRFFQRLDITLLRHPAMSDKNKAETEAPVSNRLMKRMLKIVASVKKAENDEPGNNVSTTEPKKKGFSRRLNDSPESNRKKAGFHEG
ncbi:uncharacterized protein LOC141533897 [Cotesia typhae]|uniref:uncharacterized protein LOC141533897 n=1 Tax=Cotesia typhae TaxID=2053667 RepID=UPI003D688AA0